MNKQKTKSTNKIKKKTKKTYSKKEFINTIAMSSLLIILLCLSTVYITNKKNIETLKELDKLIETYSTIKENYYGNLDKEKIVDNAIYSMLESIGDTFTNYSDEEITETFLENVEGTYEGIGCTVSTNEDKEIIVIDMFEDSPAKEAGLKINDRIIKVDGESYEDKTGTDVANYVKNSQNKKINLTVIRDNEEKEITITRKKISIPVVEGEIKEKDGSKIGYIYISIFSSNSKEQFEKTLKELEKENIEGLIIDVRYNAGGYLNVVTDITSKFLKKGKVIYQLEGTDTKEIIKDKTKEKRTYPIAILINEDSASASEILASAIKESYNGLVVGKNSYGKGTVQQTKKLKDGSMIKYTIQNWLTPNGNWINEIGVEPTDIAEENYDTQEDEQLEITLNLIKEKLN